MEKGFADVIVWSTDTGYRCVIRRYDEARYQLRLTWGDGTVKSDLFYSLDDARSSATLWQEEVHRNLGALGICSSLPDGQYQ
jgi:hypothetical protein